MECLLQSFGYPLENGKAGPGLEEPSGPAQPATVSPLDSEEHRAAVAVYQQEIRLFRAAERLLEIGGILHWFVVDFLNHIALAEPGIGGLAGRIDACDHYALRLSREFQILRRLGI